MSTKNPNVLLISIDALKPEFIFNKDKCKANLPNLMKYFVEEGSYAKSGVKSVFPTFTYPCHQSIITGTNPKKHGITNNIIFDPVNKHNGAWYWFASSNVDNLWGASKNNGYVSSSVAFPTSVAAKGDFIVPEYWWDGSELDNAFIDTLSTPQGIVDEILADIGYIASGLDLTPNGDKHRFLATKWILDNKLSKCEKPFFMSTYFASFDETMHIEGVYSEEAINSLELIDGYVGELVELVKKISGDNFVVCVVSDHGSIDVTHNIHPNVLFANNGLIDVDSNGKVSDWKVYSQRAGGCSEIRLNNCDANTITNIEKILYDLLDDENSGVHEILNKEQIAQRGGFGEADYLLVSKRGYEVRDDVLGEYCTTTLAQKAQHGFSEEFEEMYASFMIHGSNILKNNDIGSINLIDIAPTLSQIMGFELTTAEGQSVLKHIKE